MINFLSRSNLFAVLMLLAACGRPATPQAASKAAAADETGLAARLDRLVTEYAASHAVGGFGVAVSWHGETVLQKGYGLANVEKGQAVDDRTLFAIGSETKQFTAAAVLQLAAAGKLDLDADIHDYVPQYPAHQPKITLRHLLSHTSGIPDYFPTAADQQALILDPVAAHDLIARVASAPLDFPTGANFAYSNTNFFLLGLAIEKVSGETYDDYVQRHLVAPLGLQSTVACDTGAAKAREAQGYLADATGHLTASPDLDMSWAYAAGNLCSTTADMITWIRALHHGGVLPPTGYAVMTTPRVLADGTPTTYGTGLFVDSVQGHRHVEHGGDTATFASQGAAFPDDDLAIVVLTNTEDSTFDRFALERALGREVLGLAAPGRTSVPLPVDLGRRIAGSYTVPGRQMLGPNPVGIAVDQSGTELLAAGQKLSLTYLGDGRFFLPGLSVDAYLTFAGATGPAPFFVVSVDEMMFGRGMRTDTNWLAKSNDLGGGGAISLSTRR